MGLLNFKLLFTKCRALNTSELLRFKAISSGVCPAYINYIFQYIIRVHRFLDIQYSYFNTMCTSYFSFYFSVIWSVVHKHIYYTDIAQLASYMEGSFTSQFSCILKIYSKNNYSISIHSMPGIQSLPLS